MTQVLSTFENTIHTTNVWLEEIMERMGWSDKHRALRALRVVLQALRDRLTIDDATHFGAQLPLLIRGMYYEGWHTAGKPLKQHRIEFLAGIDHALRYDEAADPEEICRAVFDTARLNVTPGAIKKVKHCLPADLQNLFNDEDD
jgi:uncharacterized protein (DUF2267 family)